MLLRKCTFFQAGIPFLNVGSRHTSTCRIGPAARLHTAAASSKDQQKKSKNQADEDLDEQKNGMWTLATKHYYELEVKRSKFQATAWPVDTPEQAMSLISAASDPSASHNCFAYNIGDQFRSSDDGEPGGTAGRPMLAAIQGEGLDNVCVLVVRFFGGTKLGAGGLVRAYGGAARQCLQEAPRVFVTAKVLVEMTVPCDAVGIVFRLVNQLKGERTEEEYSASGDLYLTVQILEGDAQRFMDDVRNMTSGRVRASAVQA